MPQGLFGKLGFPQYYSNEALLAGLSGLGNANINSLSAESFAKVVFGERVNRCLFRGLIGDTADGRSFGQRSVITRHVIERSTGTGWKFFREHQINDNLYATDPTQDPIPQAEPLTQSCDVVQAGEISKALYETMGYYRDIEKDPDAPEFRRLRYALTDWATRVTNKGFVRAFTHKGAYSGFGTTALYSIEEAGKNPVSCRGYYGTGNDTGDGVVAQALKYAHTGGTLKEVITQDHAKIGRLTYDDILEVSLKAASTTDAPFPISGIKYTNPYLGLTEESPHYILVVSPRTALALSKDKHWQLNVSKSLSALDMSGKASLLTGGLVYMGEINNVTVCMCQLMEGADFSVEGADGTLRKYSWSVLVGANAMGWTTGQHFYEQYKVQARPIVYGCLRFWNGAKLLAFQGGANEVLNMPANERELPVDQGALHIISQIG